MSSYNCLFRPQSRIYCCGPSQSGKSVLVKEMMLRQEECFERPSKEIHIFARHPNQPSYLELKERSKVKVHIHAGSPDPSWRPPSAGSTIIFDDLQTNIKKGQLADFFLSFSHHYDCNVVFLAQSIYDVARPDIRLINLNSTYLIVFRQLRDLSSLDTLNRQLVGAGHLQFLSSIFREHLGDKPHSFILVDLHQQCPRNFRFRSDVFPQSLKTRVFVPSSESVSILGDDDTSDKQEK